MSARLQALIPPLVKEPETEVDYMKLYEEALESARIAVRRGRTENDEVIRRQRLKLSAKEHSS